MKINPKSFIVIIRLIIKNFREIFCKTFCNLSLNTVLYFSSLLPK